MKSNVILTSSDRQLFGIQVRQETQTSFLNLSDLQDAYDSVRVQKGWSVRRIDHIVATDQFKERVYYILAKQGFINTNFTGFMKDIETEGNAKTLKSLEAWKTTGRAENKTSWCNPYIWVMIAMEMNPELYAEVVMWLTDKLILNRIEAGNFYKGLTAQLYKWKAPNYALIASLINRVVFGRHEVGIRQKASEKELKTLSEFERTLAYLIENGFIKTENELIAHLKIKQVA
jgi:hypothetical protein